MKKSIFVYLSLLLFGFGQRVVSQSFVGTWNLTDQREMAAGFDFMADSTFRFFYTYGACDRFAEGKWTVRGDTLVLKSNKEPGRDFLVKKQSTVGSGYHIIVKDQNALLLQDIRCFAFSKGKMDVFFSNRKGEIKIPGLKYDTLYLQHLFFPDIATLIKDKANKNKTFELALSPRLAEVSFKGIVLWKEEDGTLHCLPNYFMPMENIRFEKSK